MAYGAYLGILFQSHFFRTLNWSGMLKTTLVKFLLRFLILIAIAVPFGLIFLLVPNDTDLAIMIVFKALIPILLALFLIFAFSDYLFVRFKLVNMENAGVLPIDQRLHIRFDAQPEKNH